MTVTHYIGFDVHKKRINFCAKAADGEIVEEGKLVAQRSVLGGWRTLCSVFCLVRPNCGCRTLRGVRRVRKRECVQIVDPDSQIPKGLRTPI